MTMGTTIDWRKEQQFYISNRLEIPKGVSNHSILVNPGCPFQCEYCNWKSHSLITTFDWPSLQDVENFLKDFKGDKVTISGGGEPLFNYGKDSPLNEILKTIKSLGFKTEIITRDYATAIDNIDAGNLKIDSLSISFDPIE